MRDPRDTGALTVELIPTSMFGVNLRAILPKSAWDILRKDCYKAAGNVCEICKGTGFRGRVECHERWEFDDVRHIQRLKGLICLCPTCHQVKHFGRSLSVAETGGNGASKFLQLFNHISKVNGWTEEQTGAHIETSFALFNRRSQHQWRLDIGWLENKRELIA